MNQKSQEKVLKEYKEKGEEIISEMFKVLLRAQRKNDDIKYRKILQKLKIDKAW